MKTASRLIITALCILALASPTFAQSSGSRNRDILGTLSIPPRTIPVFGQRIVYYEAGRGRTLILLANLGWDANAWFQNVPELARHYHVIALDLIGMGKSAKPLLDYKMDTWTDFLAEFMRLKHISKATVCGAVMGGALAVQFALDHPELSEGVITAASNTGPGQHAGGAQGAVVSTSLASTRQNLLQAFYDE